MPPEFDFGRPPQGRGDAARVEEAACRKALRQAKVSEASVLRAAGEDRLSLRLLAEHTDFPRGVVAHRLPPDGPVELITRFRKSNLWRAWCEVWESDESTRPGSRALVLRGPPWGFLVACDYGPPDRPHLVVGHEAGTKLYLEPFGAWLSDIPGWEPPPREWVDEPPS